MENKRVIKMRWLLDPRIILAILVTFSQTSALYKCPESCKCHSKDVFCVGEGLASLPIGIPWNKTVVYIRLFKVENETLKAEDVDSNNVTKSLTLQNLGIGDIEDGTFESFENLEFLDLNENNLTKLRNGIFLGLERVKTLHVRKNRLKEIDMDFHYVKSLRAIDFSYNCISNLTWMPRLGSNQYLPFVRYSHSLHRMKYVSASQFVSISITLSSNPLGDVNFQAEESFRFGIRMFLLDIGLQQIPFISMAVSYLDLSHNNITVIEHSDMHKIGFESRYMNDLLLNNNNLARIAPGAFNRLRRLRSLHLENNVLETFPQYLPNTLYFLYLSSNRITKVGSFQFKERWSLNHLSLKNNKINEIFSCSFCGLSRLQILSLDGNRISVLPAEGFMGLDSLETLGLSRNRVQRMESGCFVGLRKIKLMDMSFISNEIDIDGDVFDPLASLEELIIKGSPHLANFLLSSSRSLATVKNIRRLDISHNKLINLIIDVSMFFPRLTSLDISANRWKCNRDADFIIKLVKSHRHVFTHSDIICHH